MIEYQLDPLTWFRNRELKHTPKHFTVTKHEFTAESKQWVLDKFSGRFSIVHIHEDDSLFSMLSEGYLAFEDPQEALFYELKWS
jgi:hypothetical protein